MEDGRSQAPLETLMEIIVENSLSEEEADIRPFVCTDIDTRLSQYIHNYLLARWPTVSRKEATVLHVH